MLPGVTLEGTLTVAEDIQQNIKTLAIEHSSSDAAPIISLSIGVSHLSPSPEQNQEQLIKLADINLYAAKSRGRDQIVCDGVH